jgi:hypothetical protein
VQGSVEPWQLDEYQAQSVHDPEKDPFESPLSHAPLELQKPHPESRVQSSHVDAAAEQGSLDAPQSKEYHDQSLHVPELAPLSVPLVHEDVSSHQPQPAS